MINPWNWLKQVFFKKNDFDVILNIDIFDGGAWIVRNEGEEQFFSFQNRVVDHKLHLIGFFTSINCQLHWIQYQVTGTTKLH